MHTRLRLFLLVMLMIGVTVIAKVITIGILYSSEIEDEREHLYNTVNSYARLIEAVAAHDRDYAAMYSIKDWKKLTFRQIQNALSQIEYSEEDEQLIIAEKADGMIRFIAFKQGPELDKSDPIPIDENMPEPLRLAFEGKSGVIYETDRKGMEYISAYSYIPTLETAIVKHRSMESISIPFKRASYITTSITIVLVFAASFLFILLTNPILKKLHSSIAELKKALEEVRTLSGLLPICASCKKIRDDKGYWNRLEDYVKTHTGADFTHGICPECAEKLYGRKPRNRETGKSGES